MIKNPIGFIFIISIFCQFLYSEEVFSIKDKIIYEKEILPSDETVISFFKKTTGRFPNEKDENDKEKLLKIKYSIAKLQLASIANKYVFQQLKNIYYTKVVNQEDIDALNPQISEMSDFNMKRNTSMLKAVEYIQKSNSESKYQEAFDKFLKENNYCGLDFFKNNCHNKDWIDFLKKQLEDAKSKKIPAIFTDNLFREKLSAFAISEMVKQDKDVAVHLKLAEKHKCNYKDMVVKLWMIQEINKMTYNIYMDKYGNRLEDILWPSLSQYSGL